MNNSENTIFRLHLENLDRLEALQNEIKQHKQNTFVLLNSLSKAHQFNTYCVLSMSSNICYEEAKNLTRNILNRLDKKYYNQKTFNGKRLKIKRVCLDVKIENEGYYFHLLLKLPMKNQTPGHEIFEPILQRFHKEKRIGPYHVQSVGEDNLGQHIEELLTAIKYHGVANAF
jgi:hypothetical protein